MAEKELGLGVLFYANAGNVLAKINEVQAKVRTLASEITNFAKTSNVGTTALNSLKEGTAAVGAAVGKFSSEVKGAAAGMSSTGKAASQAGAQMKAVSGTITTGAASARAAVPYYERLGVAIRSLAAWIPAAMAISGLTMAFRSGIQAVVDYDQALKNLQAITNATNAETALMGDKIREVASLTKFSTKEVAEGMVFIGQAGFSAGEAIDTIQAAAMLATGTLSDLKTSSDLVTTALRVFHMNASESSRVADVFANAVNKSKTTVEGLKVSLNYLGPVAHASGLTLEESAAAVMALANSGIRASTIGTSLRQMLSRLAAPTKKMREEFAAANVDIKKFNVSTDGLAGTAGKLSTVLKGDVSKAFQLFGLRAANAAIILSALGKEGMEFLTDQASEVGSAVRMAEKQMEGLGVAAKNLRDKIELLAISIGTGGLSTALKVVIDILRPLVDILSALASSVIGQLIITTGGLTLAFIGLGKAVGLLSAALVALTHHISMKAAFAMMAEQGETLSFVWTKLSSVAVMLGRILQFSLLAAFTAVGAVFHVIASKGATLLLILVGLRAAFANLAKSLLLLAIHHPIAALALLIASFYTLKKVSADYILATEKLAITHATTAQKLSDYNKMLQENYAHEYKREKLIERILKDFPKLKGSFDNAGGSLNKYTEALEKEIAAEKELARQKTVEALENTAEAWEEASEDVAYFRYRLDLASGATGRFQSALSSSKGAVIGFLHGAVNFLTDGLRNVVARFGWADSAIVSWGKKLLSAEDDVKTFEKATASLVYRLEKLGDRSKSLELLKAFPPETQGRIMRIVESLHKFDKTMQDIGQDTSEYQKQFVDTISELDDKWAEHYAKQDASGKLFTLQHAQNLKKQLNELDKAREQMALTDEQYEAERQRILDDGFRKMEAAYIAEYDKITKVIEDHYTDVGSIRDARFKEEKEQLSQSVSERLAVIETSNQDELAIQEAKYILYEEYYDKLIGLSKDELKARLRDVEDQQNAMKLALDSQYLSAETYQKNILKIEKDTVEKVKGLYQDVLSELRTTLSARQKAYEQFAGAVKKLEDDIFGLSLRYEDRIDRLRRQGLEKREEQGKLATQIEEKYAKARELVAKGEYEKANQYYSQIEGLVGELTVYKNQEADKQLNKQIETLEAQLRSEKTFAGLSEEEERRKRTEIWEQIQELKKKQDEHRAELIKDERESANLQIKEYQRLRDEHIDCKNKEKAAYEELRDVAKKSMDEIKTKIGDIVTELDTIQKKEVKLNLAYAEKQLDEFKTKLEGYRYELVLAFLGKGSETLPISEKIAEIEDKLKELQKMFEDITKSFEIVLTFMGDTGDGNKPLLDALSSISTEFDKILQHIEENVILIKVDNLEATTRVQEVLTIVKELTAKVWTVTVNIITKGWEELVKAAAAWSVLEDKTITVTIKTKHEGGGLKEGGEVSGSGSFGVTQAQKGGHIPGYGGGDKVPALLEKGEWVIPKEEVRRYGSGFMRRLQHGEIPEEQLPRYQGGGEVHPYGDPGYAPKYNLFDKSGYSTLNKDYAVLDKSAYASLQKDYAVLQPHIESEGSRVFQNVGRDLNGYTMKLDPGQGWSLSARIRNGLFAMTNAWRAMASEATLKAKYKAGQLFPSKVITSLMSASFKRYVDERLPILTAQSARLHWDTVPGAFVQAYGNKAAEFAESELASSDLGTEGMYQKGGRVNTGNSWLKNLLAFLENGEFVIPKDVVSRQGISFFENLMNATNTMRIPKFHEGGLAGGMATSGQIHTINLTINGEPHTLYGDDVNINKLTTNLRRAQLVRA